MHDIDSSQHLPWLQIWSSQNDCSAFMQFVCQLLCSWLGFVGVYCADWFVCGVYASCQCKSPPAACFSELWNLSGSVTGASRSSYVMARTAQQHKLRTSNPGRVHESLSLARWDRDMCTQYTEGTTQRPALTPAFPRFPAVLSSPWIHGIYH